MSSKLRVLELRDELSKRGLDTTGLKPVLVCRLDKAIASETQRDNLEAKNDEAPPETDKDDEKESGKKTNPRDDDSNAAVKRMKVGDVDKLMINELKSSQTAIGSSTNADRKKRLASALQDQSLLDGDNKEDVGERIVTVTKKGKAVLDPNLPEHIKADFHVLEFEDQIFYAMLNQTNVGGNNNKYYVIQALESDATSVYILFTRWGRVGAKGQSKVLGCQSKIHCISQFKRTFHEKTHNSWECRHSFTSYPGKYTLLEMDYEAEKKPQLNIRGICVPNSECSNIQQGEKEANERGKSGSKAPVPPASSNLNPLVEKLISLICNISTMKQEMMEIGIVVLPSALQLVPNVLTLLIGN